MVEITQNAIEVILDGLRKGSHSFTGTVDDKGTIHIGKYVDGNKLVNGNEVDSYHAYADDKTATIEFYKDGKVVYTKSKPLAE